LHSLGLLRSALLRGRGRHRHGQRRPARRRTSQHRQPRHRLRHRGTVQGGRWQVYTNHEVGDGGGNNAWVGDFGDNPLWFYQQYEDSENATTAAGRQLAIRGAVQPWQPSAGTPLGPNHVNHVLAQFLADATAGTLPQVSWIVAPDNYSEHPAASPGYGAHYVRAVLEALMGNQELWNSTALFVAYDEHDGYFDHVLPPAPDASVTDEFIDGLPIGFGNRVPMIIACRGPAAASWTPTPTTTPRCSSSWRPGPG
jgi:phospholipase C